MLIFSNIYLQIYILQLNLLFRKQMYWPILIHNVALKDLMPMIALHVDSLSMIQLYALEVQLPLLEFALETAEVSSLFIVPRLTSLVLLLQICTH